MAGRRKLAESEECLKQPRLPSRSQRSVDGERVWRAPENGAGEPCKTAERTLEIVGTTPTSRTRAHTYTHAKKFRRIPRGKGLPRVLRGRADRLHEDERFARVLVASLRVRTRVTDPRPAASVGAARGRTKQYNGATGRKKKLSYETSYNCTPIGPAEECNLSPGPASGVYLRE